MWTVLALLCLTSTLELSSARTPLRREHSSEQLSSSETKMRNTDEAATPLELPTTSFGNAHFKRIHIDNQTGMDGKVHAIHIDSDEDKPGIHAYGLPKKNLQNSGLIERVPLTSGQNSDDARSGRLIQAYGMSKKRLENNGEIERVVPPVLTRNEAPASGENRVPRSIDDDESNSQVEGKPATEVEDLEAQDAKVFRPLFVYRQQMAKKQRHHRCRNHNSLQYQGSHDPCYEHRPIY